MAQRTGALHFLLILFLAFSSSSQSRVIAQITSEDDWITLLRAFEERVPSHVGKWKLTRIWPASPKLAQDELDELERGLKDPDLREDYKASEENMRRRAAQWREGYTDRYDVEFVYHNFRKCGITKNPVNSTIVTQYFANDEGVIYCHDGRSVTLLLDRGQLIRQLGAGIPEFAIGELLSDIRVLKILKITEDSIVIGFRCSKCLVNISVLRDGLLLQSVKCGIPSDVSPDYVGSEYKSISFEITFENFTGEQSFRVPGRSITKVFNSNGSLFKTEIWDMEEWHRRDARNLPSVDYTVPNGIVVYDRLGQELRVYKSDEILKNAVPVLEGEHK